MKKVVIFAFSGEMMCFVHALLNSIDMKEKGYDIKLVIEGSATKLIKELNSESNRFHKFYRKVTDEKILAEVCRACASQMGTLEDAKKQGLPLGDDMMGHPSIAKYIDDGYEVISLG